MCLLELFRDIFKIKLCSHEFHPLAVAVLNHGNVCEICVSVKSMQIHLISEGNVDRRFSVVTLGKEMPVVCLYSSSA